MTRELREHWKGSFEEYVALVRTDPAAHMRAARQYVRDAVLAFGTEELVDEASGRRTVRYLLFTDEFPSRKERAVYGMDRSIAMLMRHLESRAARQRDLPRMIVLAGPPGSAKSTTLERLRVALEEYSLTDEGACFTTTVVLPAGDTPGRGPLGLLTGREPQPESFAHLPTDQVLAQITCPQRDSPLLWYPREVRRERLEDLLGTDIPDELLYDELCPTCSQVQDHLLAHYEGDWKSMMRHVRVERFRMKGESAGAATVKPGDTSNLISLAMTQDPNYQHFADRLPGIRLVELDGPFLRANRGFIHLEDFVKANKDFTYLLRAISNGQVTTRDLRTGKDTTIAVDEVLFATDNVQEVQLLRSGNSQGFDSRIFVLDWPYVVEPSQEARVYEGDFLAISSHRPGETKPHLAPHVRELVGLFSVLTRYEKPDPARYDKPELKQGAEKLVGALTPLDKAQLFEGKVPRGFTKEEARVLTKPLWNAVLSEYPAEGLAGIGVRDMQEIVNLLSPDDVCPCIEPTDLFRVIDDYLKTRSFHYLDEKIAGEYHDVRRALLTVREEHDRIIRSEVLQAVTDVARTTIADWVRTYTELAASSYEAKHLPKPRGEQPDARLRMEEIEKAIGVPDAAAFREEIRTRLSLFSEQLQDDEGYRRVFADVFDSLESHQYRKVAERIFPDADARQRFLERLLEPDEDSLGREVTRIVRNMEAQGYCTSCARFTLLQVYTRKLL